MREIISMELSVFAICISLASLLVALRSLRIAKAKLQVDLAGLREEWIERFSKEFTRRASSNISLSAGLSIAHLADSMPSSLASIRREIIEKGFYRAVPGRGFHEFWNHLCDIQGWPEQRIQLFAPRAGERRGTPERTPNLDEAPRSD